MASPPARVTRAPRRRLSGGATSEARDVTVQDGLLEIEFRAQKGWWADVAAIEVTSIP